uniref:Uncharacterized protein n=1 Tax=Phage sp. ctGns7 TaxID=2828003 RepID=A0A8S5S9K3_9VIRU|nr:MAG TPA: hypothetical protein [Phage sp. ctGns7]DAF83697.1 MAG TPA: hypothetical protein [Caudoviricetes sp.]DAN05884.1 MAG TPA: hypothetical protein [Caudoviricetes sp.]
MEGERGDVLYYIPTLLPMRLINMGLQLYSQSIF